MSYYRIILVVIFISTLFDSFNATTFIFNGFAQCPDSEKNPAHFNGTADNIGWNKYMVNGQIKVDEFTKGPLEVFMLERMSKQQMSVILIDFQLQVQAKGCDFKMNRCDSQHTFVLPDICKVLNQENRLWADVVAHTKPRFKCPIKRSVYEVINATSDLSFINHLPLDGYTWTVTFKMFKPIANVRHKKQMHFCIIMEATVMRGHQRPKVENQSSLHTI